MMVIILENVRTNLRGELSRWLFEIKAGVFAGRVSGLVRDELWQLVQQKVGKGSALMIHSTNNEQGFTARAVGNPSRSLVDIEGLLLVRTR
uniref:CRISPR-associated protein Cas2 n=1 Tax=Cyanothece sp. (strain PCC 7425 / ATCC 29141) TaxID=395961 RepID=B8HWH5_CYAP4